MPKVKVIESGFVAGEYRKAGETLELSIRQANTAMRRGRVDFIAKGDETKGDETNPTKESLKATLDAAEISYRDNASLESLQKLVDEVEADPTA